jgi:hypothetical protein
VRCTSVVALSLLAAAMPAMATDIVYSNTATPLNTFYPLLLQGQSSSAEVANTFTRGHPGRSLTQIRVRMRIGGTGVSSFTARVRLYGADPLKGEPASQLWDSGDRSLIIDSGADLQYALLLPGNFAAPERMSWSVQIVSRSGPNQAPMGPAHYDSPTIGTVAPGGWIREIGGAWMQLPAGTAAFGAEITACYINCDSSPPPFIVSVSDYTCFLQQFAAGSPYANCDQSTAAPVLNVADFTCFVSKVAQGCP